MLDSVDRANGAYPAREQLRAMIAKACAGAETADTVVPGLNVAWFTSPMAPASYLYAPSLCICVSGVKQIVLGSERFSHGADRFLLTAIEVPTIVSIDKARLDAPYVGLQIVFDLEVARQIITEIDLDGLETPHDGTCMSMGVLTDDLLDAVVRLVKLTGQPRNIPALAGLIHREILYRLAIGPSGGRLRQIVRLGSTTFRVAKAMNWLRGHFTERLRVEELARLAGMGPSTLHRHFQQLTAMSPIQYQKHLRLHEARRLLISEEVDAGTAAFRVGYESVTQFNREYRRLFGRPPMHDVKALRLASAS